MRALVTTPTMVLFVDMHTREVIPIAEGQGEYYGISWFPGDPRLVLSHSAIENTDLTTFAALAQSEMGWLSLGGARVGAPFLVAPHQILCCPDGRIVATNTGRNTVTATDPHRPRHRHEVRVPRVAPRWDGMAGGSHLNSVFLRGDRLHVIACARRAVVELEYPSLEEVSVRDVGHSTLHGLWVTSEGEHFACVSAGGRLVELRSGRTVFQTGCPTYLRGIGATDDWVMLGASEIAVRADRVHSPAGIYLLDRATWEPVDYLPLGPVGGIQELRLVDLPDDAHHGHPLTGWESLRQGDLRARSAQSALTSWSDLRAGLAGMPGAQVLAGWPTVGPGAQISAQRLCLVSLGGADEAGTVTLTYDLSEPQSGTVAVGLLADDCIEDGIDALLVSGGSSPELARWTNRARVWSREPGGVPVPIRGRLRVRRDASGLQAWVDDLPVIQVTAADLCNPGGALGVRLQSARVLDVSYQLG